MQKLFLVYPKNFMNSRKDTINFEFKIKQPTKNRRKILRFRTCCSQAFEIMKGWGYLVEESHVEELRTEQAADNIFPNLTVIIGKKRFKMKKRRSDISYLSKYVKEALQYMEKKK